MRRLAARSLTITSLALASASASASPRASSYWTGPPAALLVELSGLSIPSGACVVPDDGSFASSDGGCLDLATGIVWGQGSATTGSPLQGTTDWAEAVAFCEDSLEAGFDDWFLPTIDQLSIVWANGGTGHLNVLSGGLGFRHWSSSTKGKQRAWTLSFPSGNEEVQLKSSRLVLVCARIAGTPNPPAAPSGLGATAISSSEIDLAWTDNASDEIGFQVERSLDGVSFSTVTIVPSNTTSFSDAGLAAATAYWYRVLAYNGTGNSDYSNSASATTSSGSGGPAVANGEVTIAGSISQGSFVTTHFDDDLYEVIVEEETGGKPSNRTSLLEHKWTFSVQGGTGITLQGFHFIDREDFDFAWSLTDGNDYVSIGTITNGPEQTLSYTFASPVSGTVWVRVVDTDRAAGNRALDAVRVDYIAITTD